MIKNMGSMDRIARVVIAIIIAILDFTEVITGTLAWVLSIIAAVFLITSLINFCPLYKVLGIQTNKNES